MTLRIPDAVANAVLNLVADLADAGAAAGTLSLYSGAQPANANGAPSGTLLATVDLVDPAFGAAAARSVAIADPAPVTGAADGDAGWFRVEDSNGTTVFDGAVTVTGGGGELELSTVTVSVGVTVDITGFSLSV